MAVVVVIQIRCGLLLVDLDIGRYLMRLVLMAEVLGRQVLRVRIVIRHRGPGELERDQAKQEIQKETSHADTIFYAESWCKAHARSLRLYSPRPKKTTLSNRSVLKRADLSVQRFDRIPQKRSNPMAPLLIRQVNSAHYITLSEGRRRRSAIATSDTHCLHACSVRSE